MVELAGEQGGKPRVLVVDDEANIRELFSAALGLPVLFLTARDAVRDRIAGLTAGGDDYVTKPTTEAATASVLTVGRCVTATGEADDTGAVTATRIAVSDPVDGDCPGGFGPGGGS